MMDRNLGATSSIPGSGCEYGLLYQWGRKDPFLGAQYDGAWGLSASTIEWPTPVVSDATNGTIEYVVSHHSGNTLLSLHSPPMPTFFLAWTLIEHSAVP